MPRTRALVFAAVVAVCAVGAAVAMIAGVDASAPTGKASADAARVLPEARAARRPVVLFTGAGQGAAGTGQLELASLRRAPEAAKVAPMRCARAYFAGGVGLCVAAGEGFAAGYSAEIFGPGLRVRHRLGLEGVASRARVSPDGRYGAVTMFVSGHSYASAGRFSTETTLIDMATGQALGDLEQFTVSRDGRQVTAVDANYWGMTFGRDSDLFYATLATGGRTYLLRGSVRARTARVIGDNVECPSLSPDGTRIAYKKRVRAGANGWRLSVLDLRTMQDTPLAETRSVDDQAEWLDDGHVLYGLDGSVWSVPADGRGRPARFAAGAASPAVVRW